jgi:hypothetical protein
MVALFMIIRILMENDLVDAMPISSCISSCALWNNCVDACHGK